MKLPTHCPHCSRPMGSLAGECALIDCADCRGYRLRIAERALELYQSGEWHTWVRRSTHDRWWIKERDNEYRFVDLLRRDMLPLCYAIAEAEEKEDD